jgi:hypothetical protein
MPEPILMKTGTWVYLNSLLYESLSSVCVSVCMFLCIFARQRLSRHISVTTNTRNNTRIVRGVVFCMVNAVSDESLWVRLCIPLSLIGNGSVNTFSRQRRVVGGVVFYEVLVVSKESRWLVLPRTSCLKAWGSCWSRYWVAAHSFTNVHLPSAEGLSFLRAI